MILNSITLNCRQNISILPLRCLISRLMVCENELDFFKYFMKLLLSLSIFIFSVLRLAMTSNDM